MKNFNHKTFVFYLLVVVFFFIGNSMQAQDTLRLSASRDYSPTVSIEGDTALSQVVKFAIPEYLEVTEGNAGNGIAKLTVSINDLYTVVLTYKGGASNANPTSPVEIEKGLKYSFMSSSDGRVAGDSISANKFNLKVQNGSNSFGKTRITTSIKNFKVATSITASYSGCSSSLTFSSTNSFGAVWYNVLPDGSQVQFYSGTTATFTDNSIKHLVLIWSCGGSCGTGMFYDFTPNNPNYPTLAINPSTVSKCADNVPINLTVSGSNYNPTTINWTHNSSNSPTVSVNPTMSTGYTVTASSAMGCSSSATSDVTIIQPPVIQATATPFSIPCTINSTLRATLVSPSGSTINNASAVWTSPGQPTLTGNPVTVLPSAPCTYTVNLTTTPGNCQVSSSVNLIENAPTITVTGGTKLSCTGGSNPELCANLPTACPPLRPGDIAIVSYRRQGPRIHISFVAMVDLLPCASVNFTTMGYSQATNGLVGNGGMDTWTNPTSTTIPAGTVIRFNNANTGFSSPTNGNDQLIAYQGTAPNLNFIYALNKAQAWTAGAIVNPNRDSNLPLGLTNGSTAIFFTPNENERRYIGLVNGPRATLLSTISNPTNWQKSNQNVLFNSMNITDRIISGFVWSPGGATTLCITATTSGVHTVTYKDPYGCTTTASVTIIPCIQTCNNSNLSPKWATYFGGTGADQISEIVVKRNNNIVVLGNTDGVAKNLPTTGGTTIRDIGTSQGSGDGEVFLAEVSADGQTVLWINYIHTGAPENITSIAIDKADDNVYLVLQQTDNFLGTYTYNYIGAVQTSNSLFRFGNNGSLNWSKEYIMTGTMQTIASGNDGYLYIAGSATGITGSSPNRADLPAVLNGGLLSQQSFLSGDMFVMKVAKLDASDSWSRLLDYYTFTSTPNPCSKSTQTASKIVWDNNTNNAYVCGTQSLNSCVGGSFLSKGLAYGINQTGTVNWAKNYTGTNNFDQYTSICVDQGTLALVGLQNAGGFGPNGLIGSDIYLERLNINTGTPIATRVIGGTDTEVQYDIVADGFGKVYVTGYTASNDILSNFASVNAAVMAYHSTHTSYRPLAPNPTLSQDIFVGRFFGTTFIPDWFTYYGSATTVKSNQNNDIGYGLAVDNNGNIYVVGVTASQDFETSNPLQITPNPSQLQDGAIVKFGCTSGLRVGAFTAFDSESVGEGSGLSNFSYSSYPNPFSNSVVLTLPGDQTFTMALIDSKGNIVLEQSDVVNQATLNLSTLVAGLYQLKLSNDLGNTFLKLVKAE